MTPGPDCILTCPTCGKTKNVLTLSSWNTFGSTLWSDTKYIAPIKLEVSAIQKCPHCGHYFLLSRQQYGSDECSTSDETGELSYEELKEAWYEITLAIKEKTFQPFTHNEAVTFLLYLIWGYNDTYFRGKALTPPEEERQFFATIASYLMLYDINELLKAEIYRELGDFEACRNILNALTCEEDFHQQIKENMLTQCDAHNTQVFQIY